MILTNLNNHQKKVWRGFVVREYISLSLVLVWILLPSVHCIWMQEYTLLQDLTQDSATQTGWRRTHRSGEGKMIALYGPGICSLRYWSFPGYFRNPEFSGDLNGRLSGESLAYAGTLHSSMPEDISRIFRRFPCEKMKECAPGRIELVSWRILIFTITTRPQSLYETVQNMINCFSFIQVNLQ